MAHTNSAMMFATAMQKYRELLLAQVPRPQDPAPNVSVLNRLQLSRTRRPPPVNINGYAEDSTDDITESPNTPMNCEFCGTHECVCIQLHIGSEGGLYSSSTLSLFYLKAVQRRELDVLARRFYGAIALAKPGNSAHTRIRDEIIYAIAEELCNAIVLACAGEFRYSAHRGMIGLTQHVHADKLVKIFNMRRRGSTWEWGPRVQRRLGKCVGSGYAAVLNGASTRPSIDRGSFAIEFHRLALQPYGRTAALRTLRNGFLWDGKYYSKRVNSGYGGITWAACAQVAYDYSRGRISAIEFVDRAFDLQHNSATVFNKTHCVTSTFKYWLDARSEASVGWLARWTPNDVREAFGLSEIVQIAPYRQLCHQDAPLPPDDRPVTTEYLSDTKDKGRDRNQRARRRQRGDNMLLSLARLVHAEDLYKAANADDDENESVKGCTDCSASLCCYIGLCDKCHDAQRK